MEVASTRVNRTRDRPPVTNFLEATKMSKRSATENESLDGQSFSKARQSAKDGLSSAKRPSLPPDTNEDMGEFEDEWEDELESDEDAVDRAAEGLEGMSNLRASAKFITIQRIASGSGTSN